MKQAFRLASPPQGVAFTGKIEFCESGAIISDYVGCESGREFFRVAWAQDPARPPAWWEVKSCEDIAN